MALSPVKNLFLNEELLQQLPDHKRSVCIFEWLCHLESALPSCDKTEVKNCQKKLVQQLLTQINGSPGPPVRKLLANCLATLFSVGDTFMLFDTANACNDILKNKDDSPSFMASKLAAICVLGSMYEKLGRMMGRSYEETVSVLLKTLRNAESQARIAIMVTLEKICAGMGTAISNVHKDIYKASKVCLVDRVMSVRIAAAKCILELIQNAPFIYQSELESLSSLCFRAFDGSNYEVRCAVARLIGTLLAYTQQQQEENVKKQSPSVIQSGGTIGSGSGVAVGGVSSQSKSNASRTVSLDETLVILMSGFLRGGASFLKGTGEIIKGSSGVNREIRVGVTHAYVAFVEYMGGAWLERNLSTFLTHVLDLVANPKAASSHVEAVYSRKCINFILRSVLGKMLGEKAQITACKELIHMVAKQMNVIDFSPENAKDSNQETLFSQHFLVCALQELASLVQGLGTTAQNLLLDQTLNAIDTICAVLIHPCAAARLSAAWCMRCFCIALPSLITPLIDRFLEALDQMRSAAEAISGYSCALAAVLGSVQFSPLGIPYTKGKVIFNVAEELLRSASQSSRMSLSRTQAGWLLIGSIMTLESSVVKGLLPRLLLLWRHSFPRSNKELESEKARGDAFTWQVTLEGRAGALSVMYSFLLNCPDLVTEDIIRRLLVPIESAMAMLVNLSAMLKSYGTQLKASVALVRLRLYETLSQLPSNALDCSYTHLLRILITEFTLAENPANTVTSLLRFFCCSSDTFISSSTLQETNHHVIEDQLHFNSAAGSRALEHDPCCLYRRTGGGSYDTLYPMNNFLTHNKTEQGQGPLPLGVAIIDMSIVLFGVIFPKVANKHRIQMFDHFVECIKQAKSSRQEAIQINIFTALLSGLKGQTDAKINLGSDDVRKSAINLILSALTSPNALLRCASAESLGRLAQVVAQSRFTADLAQNLFEKLKSARDIVTRTGHSLALGCLHRYVGSMGSSQHLNTNVSILLALAQDTSSPVVQLWALHALALIADSGGPMLHGYVEATLTLCLKLLLSLPQSYVEMHQCIGRVLNALITTMGPELQANTDVCTNMRKSFMNAASIMGTHSNALVQAEAVGCLQQLHLFSPESVHVATLVPTLVRNLSSNYLAQRKAAVFCLRQIVHREARLVCDLALNMKPEDCPKLMTMEYGLPGILFAMLDYETDTEMLKNIRDTLTSMITLIVSENLGIWLSICKNVLTTAVENITSPDEIHLMANKLDLGVNTIISASSGIGGSTISTNSDTASKVTDDDDEDADDNTEYHANDSSFGSLTAIQPRWATRVFAAQCVRKICEVSHEGLIVHLSELIRMAFIAATSDSDQLRLEGLHMLHEIIDRFANVPEPEFPGHFLLEQYQAQVGAALRPAFSSDTPSHITAVACEVCSAWIGSGVARNLNDLRRVHQLLVSSLNKLNLKPCNTQLFNESMATLEKLSILKAWAVVYIVAMEANGMAPAALLYQQLQNNNENSSNRIFDGELHTNDQKALKGLLLLVEPELENLSMHWLSAMKDHALLLLPAEFHSQLPHDGGAFYTTNTITSSKPHYLASWPPILYATALWLKEFGFQEKNDKFDLENKSKKTTNCEKDNDEGDNSNENDGDDKDFSSDIENMDIGVSTDRFHMLFGICIEALCSTRTMEKPKNVISCLQTLYTMFHSEWARRQLIKDRILTIELCNVLHRQILTSDNLFVHHLCIGILKLSVLAAREDLLLRQSEYSQKSKSAHLDNTSLQQRLDGLGEGLENGETIRPGASLVYAILEACLCLFVRQIPNMNAEMGNTQMAIGGSVNNSSSGNVAGYITNNVIGIKQNTSTYSQSFFNKVSDDKDRIIANTLECVEELLTLCSPQGALSILPTVLYVTTATIKEMANKSVIDTTVLANTYSIRAVLHVLETVCKHKWSQESEVSSGWQELLQSCLATIIDLTKTAGDHGERKMDEITMMETISVFLMHASSAAVFTVPSLQYPCINHFRHYLQSENLAVKLKCIEITRSIYQKAELKIAVSYIHALSPRIIEGLYIDPLKQLQTDVDLQILIESIQTVEVLIELAEPKNRIQILSLLVPVLINYLLDPSKSISGIAGGKYQQQLHEFALQLLLKIGPKYAQEFRAIMGQSLELRQKLEVAIRGQQQRQQMDQQQTSIGCSYNQQQNQVNRSSVSGSNMDKHDNKPPTIQLKTNFSNFH